MQHPEELFQVTRWAIEPTYSNGNIAVRLNGMTSALEEHHRYHQLTPEQGLAIAHDIIKAVTALGID